MSTALWARLNRRLRPGVRTWMGQALCPLFVGILVASIVDNVPDKARDNA